VAAVVRRRRIGFVAAFLVGRDPWVVAFLFWAGILYTGISIEIFYINKRINYPLVSLPLIKRMGVESMLFTISNISIEPRVKN